MIFHRVSYPNQSVFNLRSKANFPLGHLPGSNVGEEEEDGLAEGEEDNAADGAADGVEVA